jgi:hypothetical protein
LEDISYPRLFIGPMSKLVVDSVGEYCNEKNVKIGLIPSRRQVEYDGGYVCGWNTSEFAKYSRELSKNIVLQRDHGGLGQCGRPLDPIEMKIYTAGASFREDALSSFDLIHIDPWKRYKSVREAARETISNINFISIINSNVLFEVGTEEAIRPYEVSDLNDFVLLLKDGLSEENFNKIKYLVIQSGTGISGTKNIGKFNKKRCLDMIDFCKSNGFLSKEHNGDYLNTLQIKKRFNLGLDGINIAPEFGVSETRVILNEIKRRSRSDLFEKLFEMVYDSNKWQKWLPDGFSVENIQDKEQIIKVGGHYVFSNRMFFEITNELPDIKTKIKKSHKNRIEKISGAIDRENII